MVGISSAIATRTEWLEFTRQFRSLLASCRIASQRDELLATLPEPIVRKLAVEWRYWARPKQIEPAGPWATWLCLAGRGWGKSRTGAEWILEQARQAPVRIALVGTTAADVRDVMIEGESGLLACIRPDETLKYEPSKRRVTHSSGAIMTCFSADKPDVLRGPQHHVAWCDELAAWRYPEAWDQLQFGLRLGDKPRSIVTTTPRPTQIIREMVKDPTVHVTSGSTYENESNLAASQLAYLEKRYGGSRLGRQELMAELLEDVEGALFNLKMIEALRLRAGHTLPEMKRVVVAVDPSGSSTGDECGIVICGLGKDGVGYVLGDASLQASPNAWASAAVKAYHMHTADRILGEQNYGGQMVETTLRSVDPRIPYKAIHVSRGKRLRAEPVAALYEQGRVRHVGAFAPLETEMTTWVPGDASPNRLDALVFALTELLLDDTPQASGLAAMI